VLHRLIRKHWKRARPEPCAAPIDAGGLTYAVGDVHGRYDLLARLVDRIFEDAASLGAPAKIVFLGDYIDRGEQSRETIDFLSSLARSAAAETVCLMGNHEQMLLKYLQDPETGSRWLRFGGLQTLMSYGVGEIATGRTQGKSFDLVRDALLDALGPHLSFIERLKLSHRAGNLLFAHAGADPALPPDEQEIDTLLWGCRRFWTRERSDGVWVVHGHFVVDRPSAERSRISLDTGAYFSGRLTAARITSGEVVFLSCRAGRHAPPAG
jgi:serine/threonine protein phosphatase 1